MPGDEASEILDAPVITDDNADDVSLDTIEALLRDHWGLSGQIFPVEEKHGLGYLVDNGNLRYFLDIRDLADEQPLRVEHEVMRHITRSPDGPQVPEPVAAKDGAEILTAEIGGVTRVLRLLTALDGDPPPEDRDVTEKTAAELGALLASLVKSLEDFDPLIWNGEHEDELRKAGPRTVSLLSTVADQEARDMIARAMVSALRRIHPLAAQFRIGLVIADLGPGDLTGETDEADWHPTGITNLGGLSRSWYVSALAKTCARILASQGGEPASILPAITGYHPIDPLNAGELEALWPLVIADIAFSAALAENTHAQAPDDEAAAEDAKGRRQILANASTVTAEYMHACILEACRIEPEPLDLNPLMPDLEVEKIRLVDLSPKSPLFQGGNWTDPDCDWRLLARSAWETGMGSTRYGEYRLSRSKPDAAASEPQNVALHVDICLPATTALVAPFKGTVVQVAPQLSLRGESVTLLVEGMETTLTEGVEISPGDRLGTVAGAAGAVGGLRLRLSRDPDNQPPLFCRPSEAAVWQRLAPSPSALLGMDCDAPAAISGREVRAWHEFVYDETGHTALDFSGRAPPIGHGHPSIAAASYQQHLRLSASFDGSAEVEALRQALVEIAPPGFTDVVLFEDRHAAMEAITELARSRETTEERAAVAAYLENSAEDEIEASADEAEISYALASEQAEREESATPLLIEPLPGIADPAEQMDMARENGRLIIVDETRSGHGRLGGNLWSIERGEMKADFLLAGSCDGGRLAAVFCNEEFSEALAPLAGPVSPVDAATALAALTVLREENLQANASAMGELLEKGLRQLAEESDRIEAIDGRGLWWTMQPVSEDAEIWDALDGHVLHDLDHSGGLILAPPLCVNEASINLCLDHLRNVLRLARIGI
jgi:Ser/Thr protein kinase RdoA (MazF antagonist)/4-aminobutyrate aminotransferase-like enzyme